MCQHPKGGFCGGHLQYTQLASTYAAVLALLTLGSTIYLLKLKKKNLY